MPQFGLAGDHFPDHQGSAIVAAELPEGGTLEEARKNLIAKIGENISVRRFTALEATGAVGQYQHGSRIGVIVDVTGGDDELRRDIAMHIAAVRPEALTREEVSAEKLER